MPNRFEAIRIDATDAGQCVGYVGMTDADLMAGDVDVAVSHSTINYKDGLAVSGRNRIVRRFPMVPGVDFAGRVTASAHKDFKPGDLVIAGGCGLGETHLGGFAQRARLPGDWLVALPEGLSPQQAMAIGTAGLTAMFCVLALERFGVTPEGGPIVVTGAAGGVGSVAVALLARLGFRVAAATGRPEEADYLESLGAAEILDRAEFAAPGKPLQSQRFAAGVDAVGGATLASILAQTQFDGAVAACGNAGGLELQTTVAPFILRGVALIGVECVRPRLPLRREAWARLARDLDKQLLARMTETIPFHAALERARAILEGRTRGRVVIEIG